jgi:hypothetical protein
MPSFIDFIVSGVVVANSDLPKNVGHGGVAVFTLSIFQEVISERLLATPMLKRPFDEKISTPDDNDKLKFVVKCLDWKKDDVYCTSLGKTEEVLLTPRLDGCTFAVFKEKKTEELITCHANYQVDAAEYVYFADGFVDYTLYETDEEGGLRLYNQSVPNEEDPEDYEELMPDEGQDVYIKRKQGGYEKKIYMKSCTLEHSQNGLIDQAKIDNALELQFPSENYERIFYITKSDYLPYVQATQRFTSVFGVRDDEKGWQFYCFTTGPNKICRVNQSDKDEEDNDYTVKASGTA